MAVLLERIRQELRIELAYRGYSHQALADKSGVHVTTIQGFLAGREKGNGSSPTLGTLAAMAEALGLRLTLAGCTAPAEYREVWERWEATG